MKIVINIPDEYFNDIKRRHKNGNPVGSHYLERIVNLGNPLPKGHGRLIDANKLKTHFVGTEQGTDLEVYLESTIIDAPTIIEADKTESEKDE